MCNLFWSRFTPRRHPALVPQFALCDERDENNERQQIFYEVICQRVAQGIKHMYRQRPALT
eukprot:5759859-Amphidinium_carterae.1